MMDRKGNAGLTLADPRTGKAVKQLKELTDCVGAAFSADAKTLASHSREGEITLWSVATGKKTKTLREKVKYGAGAYNFVVFSPDGKLLASGGHIDKSLRVWDTTTGKQKVALECKGFFVSASFSPDNSLLATGSTDGLALYDLVKDQEVCKLKAPFAGQAVLFSPDGTLLAVGADKGNVYLYQIPRGKTARLPKELPAAEVEALWQELGTKNDFRCQQVSAILQAVPKDSIP